MVRDGQVDEDDYERALEAVARYWVEVLDLFGREDESKSRNANRALPTESFRILLRCQELCVRDFSRKLLIHNKIYYAPQSPPAETLNGYACTARAF